MASSEIAAAGKDHCLEQCDGCCCQRYTVLVTTFDVQRILENLPAVRPRDFTVFYPSSIDPSGDFPRILLRGAWYCLGMAFSSRGACIWHTKEGRCAIHHFSPLVCQAYPWTLDTEDSIIFNPDAICQAVFAPREPGVTKAVVQQSWNESQRYAELVERWNAGPGRNREMRRKDFLTFCGCRCL